MLRRSSIAKPRRRNSPRPAEKSARGFLQWLRGRDCLCAGPHCLGKIEAAHVDYAGDKGMGTKVSDRYAIPLCSFHHREQHQHGWQTFEREWLLGGSAYAAANLYWSAWPGRIEWERVRKERENG